MSTICIFEDEGYRSLLPLAWFKPVFDMRCGINTLFEKIKRTYPRTDVYLLCRDHLSETTKKEHPGTFVGKPGKDASVLFLNGRLLCDNDTIKKIPVSGPDEIYECDGVIVAARLSKGNLDMISSTITSPVNKKSFSEVASTCRTNQISVTLIKYYYDLIAHNSEHIKLEFPYYSRGGITRGRMHQTVAIYARGSIFIDDNAEIEAFVTLDARKGPIFISKGVTVQPYSRIVGPCFIGEKSLITAGANIRENVSMGPYCKVGGEVEETIIHGYSNKAHYGFLGHSYLGEWVNIGAGATNSDLKNNYGSVRINYMGTEVDSGKTFLGCCMADHSKIGIGVKINTGAIIGASSNIFGGGLVHGFIPSFSWGTTHKMIKHDPERAIKTARVVMGRRGIEMDEAEVNLFRKVYELTGEERKNSKIEP